ncbi:MAG: hypothetical protein WC965_01920 [Thiohalomonadaceae bacterium]
MGNRKEVTKAEQEDMDIARRVDQMIEEGDPNWLSMVEDYLGDDLDSLDVDDDMFSVIDAEQRRRGE